MTWPTDPPVDLRQRCRRITARALETDEVDVVVVPPRHERPLAVGEDGDPATVIHSRHGVDARRPVLGVDDGHAVGLATIVGRPDVAPVVRDLDRLWQRTD